MPGQKIKKEFICPLPWTHIATSPAGSLRLCCDSSGVESRAKTKDGEDFKIYKSEAKEFLNCDNFKKIRLDMIEGVIPSSCKNCHLNEVQFNDSPRLHFLRKYNFTLDSAKDLTSRDGSLKKVEIKSIDLRLGNNCNLKCRMCNPWSSHSLSKEFQDQYNESIPILNWPDRDNLWLSVIQDQDSLLDLYLTGGEPTLIDNNLLLLKGLTDRQREETKVRVNTNGTILNIDFFKEMSSFKNNDVKISIDGTEKVNDYIRYPSKWLSVLENIKTLKGFEGLNISTHLTVSVFNLLSLAKTLKEFERLGLPQPFLDFVREPEEQSIFCLPLIFKQKFLETIDDTNSNYLSPIAGTIGQAYCDRKFQELKKKTKAIDRYRGTYIKDYIPEVGDLLE